jgi:rubrerythrin
MATDPFVYNEPRKLSNSELASAIRLDIQAELDATSLYQAHYDATDDERARAILAHIRDEEKEHAAEFTQLLAILDPYQAEELRSAPANVANMLSAQSPSSGPQGEAAGQPAQASELTVGSLMGDGQG